MLPELSSYNVPDHGIGNPEPSSDFGLIGKAIPVHCPDLRDVRAGQLRGADSLTVLKIHPAFVHRIMQVIPVGSKPEMFGINTFRNVAFMQDEPVLWNIPVGDYPGHSVSHDMLIHDSEHPVTEVVPGTMPQPAFIGTASINFLPESADGGFAVNTPCSDTFSGEFHDSHSGSEHEYVKAPFGLSI